MDQVKDSKPTRTNLSWIWWIVLLGLLIWNVRSLIPRSQAEANIPYTEFVKQVEGDNISSVQIEGSQISGQFITPITWNPPVLTQNPTPQPTPIQEQQYSAFKTTFPEIVGDPSLMNLLRDHSVEVSVIPAPSPWFEILLSSGLPILLIFGVMLWFGRNMAANQSGIFGFGRSKPREVGIERTKVTFDDVAGEDEAKQDLREVVDFLRRPEKYHLIGARVPRGVLLVGPPGTGKTLLARAVAGEADVPFFTISASEFVEMFVGVGASRVRDLFEKAKAASPSIVFIDELDAVGRRRGAGLGTVNDEREQTLNQLLVELDGFDVSHEVILIAATNRFDVLDPALLRPGRFDRQITVVLPDRKGREGILRIHTRELNLAKDVNLSLIAGTTTGFSGADLANLCNEAALVAARNDHRQVMMTDFEEALDRALLGAARTLLLNDQERRVVAYHESGHAIAAWFSPHADPVHKVTIMPHGRALGVTEQVPGEDRYNYSRPYLLDRLSVMLGGRAAEELALGEITTGAENDLVDASRLARRMITRWGMGNLGPMALSTDDEQPFLGYELTQRREYSEQTAFRIDQEVERILEGRYKDIKQLLEHHSEQLDKLAHKLLQDETITQDELVKILGNRRIGEPEMQNLPRHTQANPIEVTTT